ncbi:hypothetical protein DL96DRAFT_1642916 [Flagelloscypha sp. PMI_526]|nr:hypothetical protein DL96DRAFT_1642916 [Flagelloscypha sp. PMI_526]
MPDYGMKLDDLSFPNLKSFSMSGNIPQTLITSLPWSQITHVKMERNPEVLALLETHRCLRSLELFTSSSLTFALFGAQTGAVPVSKPNFFPSLRRLRIELSTVPSLLSDLNSLTVPNLESFALRPPERRYIGTQSFTEDSLLIIKDLVTRSGCETTLNELDFGWGGSANSKYLIPLLEITPNIKNLTLLISKPSSQDTNDGDNDNNPTALFFERLSASPVTFLPHLQTLTLPQYAVLSPYLPTILRLRWSSLSSLVLGDWTKGSRDGPRELEQTRKVMTELRRMKRDGWKVIRCQHAFPEFRKACKVCM